MLHQFVCRSNLINRIKTVIGRDLQRTPSSIIVTRFLCDDVSNPQKLTVDYLTNSCGLSPESALKVSKLIRLKSTTRPDSVLSLFKSYGFTKTHILKIITTRPQVLAYNADETMKPKLEFFSNMGISGSDLGKFLSRCPSILTTSLNNRIVPSVNYLRTLVATDNDIVHILERSLWVATDAERTMSQNITVLRDHGMPQSFISRFLMLHPQTLNTKCDRFEKIVTDLVRMGFSPLSMKFLHGLHVVTGMKKSLWDEKITVFRSFGWSEDEVLAAFKSQPFVMAASTKKINLSLCFFMNDLKWTQEDIARNSSVITLSLQKRVLPRCHVLQILLSKNLISKNGTKVRALLEAENVFLKNYVSKYHDQVPDLLEMYQSRMGTQGLLVSGREI